MFSCVLLRCGEKQEANVLVAEKATLDVQIVSNAGRGNAICDYVVEKYRGELVLCVPSVISLRKGTTQEVKLTGCYLDVAKEGRAPLHLTKLDGDYPVQTKNLPSYATVKKGLNNNISPNDVIIHLGHFKPKTALTIHIEFLLRLSSLSSLSVPCYVLENGILARQVSYKLKFASPVQIVDVSPSCSTSSFLDFCWFHTDRTEQVVHISYDTVCDLHELDETLSVCIKMAGHHYIQSACCVCLKKSSKNPSWQQQQRIEIDCEEDDEMTRGDESAIDGMMMLSTRLTPDQLPGVSESCMNGGGGGIKSGLNCLSPSEFVFLVDCSASMNPFIDSVVSTLITCIKSLPEGCFFNMIAFGSSFRQLFHESKEYSKLYVKYAVDFANQLKANLGGTDLLPPLKWIFKKARKNDMPCQVFVITDVDQEVKDVPYMLSTIRKNRHHTRCHAFGIGVDICRSLVVSIAEAGVGRSVILQEGDRLQTKVMEVLQESLEPALMEAEIRWQPPPGYSLVDSTPKSLGVIYSQQTRLAFAFLRKNSNLQSSLPKTNGHRGGVESLSPATLIGHLVGGKAVQVPVQQSIVPPLNSQQSQDLTNLLSQIGQWSKIEELEVLRLQANSRKNSIQDEGDDEPNPKRLRLNGTTPPLTDLPSASELQDDLLRLSLDSGIFCPFTYFKGHGGCGREIIQLLPYFRQQHNVQMSAVGLIKRTNGMTPHPKRIGDTRKRPMSRHSTRDQLLKQQRRHHPRLPPSNTSPSTSVVASTISAVGNSIISLVSNIFQTSSSSLDIEDGKTLEDEMAIQERKGTQLYWDESRNEIKYPQSYYQSSSKPSTPSNAGCPRAASVITKSSKHPTPVGLHEKVVRSSNSNGQCKSFHNLNAGQFLLSSLSIHPPSSGVLCPSYSSKSRMSSSTHQNCITTDNNSSSSSDDEEDDLTISDSESDSSLDLDWEALPKTREYMPIIQMQLFNGAWPMVRGFSYAIRVPPSEIRLLPLASSKGDFVDTASSVPQKHASQDIDDAHFWSTALAVVCFRECFPEFEKEWKLIVAKSECWMEQNLDQCGLGMDQVYTTARELLFRNSDN